MQTLVLFISAVGMLLVAAAFVYVIKNSASREEDYSTIVVKGYRIRRWWMIAICIVGFAVTFATLSPFPLTAMADSNPRVIKAVGGQWYWKLDDNQAVVGEHIQFQVSSADVTHGFAIYTPDNLVFAQTQAMPGYVNDLNVSFTQPGTYRILCLEYCGLAHHAMIVEFNVSEEK